MVWPWGKVDPRTISKRIPPKPHSNKSRADRFIQPFENCPAFYDTKTKHMLDQLCIRKATEWVKMQSVRCDKCMFSLRGRSHDGHLGGDATTSLAH
mmetsp:Transcript_153789/g.493135  ORF Transcript_153789/g.493135 Transcript_153789/m.493135 type:complete len:96 (+) Transcript_153789:1201-1488(+)